MKLIINCLFLMDFYEPFEEMEANNVCFFSSKSNSYSTILPCREVFARGQKDIKVEGPFPEVENEVVEVHKDYWNK